MGSAAGTCEACGAALGLVITLERGEVPLCGECAMEDRL